MLAFWPCGKLSGDTATNAGLAYAIVSGQEMLLVAVEPSALGTFVHGDIAGTLPGIPVISICAVHGTANCADVSSIRVMSEAPQVTTGVTPLALAVQYSDEMGIVKM